MPSLNQCQLIGRLTRDPERVQTNSDISIVRFSIAVDSTSKDRDGNRRTNFFDVTAFRQTADFVDQYLRKGLLVAVVGSIEIEEAENRDGVKMRYTKINASTVQNLSPRTESELNGEGGQQEEPRQQAAPPQRAARPAAPRPTVPATRKPVAVAAGNADDLDDSDPFADE